jgi:hypothetical protein
LPEQAAVYVVEGEVTVDGESLAPTRMGLLPPHAGQARLASAGGGRCVVIGGEPLDGHRFLYWNFVSSRKDRVAQAAADWEANRFPAIPGETERIPLPQRPPG